MCRKKKIWNGENKWVITEIDLLQLAKALWHKAWACACDAHVYNSIKIMVGTFVSTIILSLHSVRTERFSCPNFKNMLYYE